jgi:segregation and condensation protein B
MGHDGLTELSKAIECLLFTSADTLSADRLAEVLEANAHQVREAIELLRDTLDGRGLQIVELAGGYQLATRPEYAPLVHKMLQPAPTRLSAQALEVLAIVAYRQPITRPEIDAIRGVNSQHAVNSLAEKGIVTTVGRKEAPGRPLLYATTPHFLGTFGLRDLEALPNLEELRTAAEAHEPLVLRGVSQTGDRPAPARNEPAHEVSPAEDGGDGPEAPEQTEATGSLDE